MTEISSISINFRSRCILCDICNTHTFTIIHVDTFYGSKGDFHVSCAVTSFIIRSDYIVVNLIVVVHSTETCCANSMKLWVPKNLSFIYGCLLIKQTILTKYQQISGSLYLKTTSLKQTEKPKSSKPELIKNKRTTRNNNWVIKFVTSWIT